MLNLKSESIHQQYKRVNYILAVFNKSNKTADDLSNKTDRLIYRILLIINSALLCTPVLDRLIR